MRKTCKDCKYYYERHFHIAVYSTLIKCTKNDSILFSFTACDHWEKASSCENEIKKEKQ